jgi:hypothetical protein
MRAFIGWINYGTGSVTIPGVGSFTGQGLAGITVPLIDDLVYGANQYQPLAILQSVSDPCATTGNMKVAFCPNDVFDLDNLYEVYIRVKADLSRSWDQSPSIVRGREGWVAAPNSYVRSNIDPRYPPVGTPIAPNGANYFQDFKILDTYFFVPSGPFTLTQPSPGEYLEVIPTYTPTPYSSC